MTFPKPTRIEPRAAEPPEHGDYTRPPLTGEQARKIARENLARWVKENGY